jgi:hypothetical protein
VAGGLADQAARVTGENPIERLPAAANKINYLSLVGCIFSRTIGPRAKVHHDIAANSGIGPLFQLSCQPSATKQSCSTTMIWFILLNAIL